MAQENEPKGLWARLFEMSEQKRSIIPPSAIKVVKEGGNNTRLLVNVRNGTWKAFGGDR